MSGGYIRNYREGKEGYMQSKIQKEIGKDRRNKLIHMFWFFP